MSARWYTADELARLELPGLPHTKRNINRHAAEHGWLADPDRHRRRKGRGGGIEYHEALLPASARNALALRVATGETGGLPAPADAPEATDRRERRQAAALTVLAAWDACRRGTPGSIETARMAFCRLYSAGRILLPDWVFEVRPTLCANTLRTWEFQRDTGRAELLRGKYGTATGDDDMSLALT